MEITLSKSTFIVHLQLWEPVKCVMSRSELITQRNLATLHMVHNYFVTITFVTQYHY